MRERPLAVFVCCWLIGACIPSLWLGFGQPIAAAGGALILLGLRMAGMISGKAAAACAAALFLALAERKWVERSGGSDLMMIWEKQGFPQAADISGFVSSEPQVDGDAFTFLLAADQVKMKNTTRAIAIHETVLVRVKLTEQKEQNVAGKWKRGDSARVAGTPEKPADAGNFGAFDYRQYLERQGIHWQWSAQGLASVHRGTEAVPWRMLPQRAADELRSGIGRLMDRLYPAGDAGYMKGLVAGIADEVDPGQYDDFSRLGLTHVLAISGLHVAVVVFLLLRLGAMFRLTRERSIDIAIAAMPLYMLVTGASPSAVRACLMAMIALALARKRRLKDGVNLLAAAALLMVVWDPLVVENVSFQLSFAVTAGLMLFTGPVSGLLAGVPVKVLREALAVGITAQAVSFPLTVYYFHGFHLLSLPANLLLVPFISFAVMPLGMASVVLGAAWMPLGILPAKLATYGNRLTFELVELLSRAESLRIIWPQPSKLWVASAYVLFGGTVWVLKKRMDRRKQEDWLAEWEKDSTAPLDGHPVSVQRDKRAWGGRAALVLLWTGWLAWGYRPVFLDRDAVVQFLDVGQGDGILVRTGAGKHLLIDTGGTVRFRKPGEEWRERREPYEIGRKLLVPLLRQRGVRQLDALILTHLDADHMGGAEALFGEVPVRAVIWNGTWKMNPSVGGLFREMRKRGLPVYAASTGMRWVIDDSASLDILYPDASSSAAPAGVPVVIPAVSKQNQKCIVLVLTLYGRRFLLTGDVEAAGELEMIRESVTNNDSKPFPVDVMKAAHHGSKTSTTPEWLAWWHPAEVVISVGRRNLYGHPHPAVTARIEDSGSALFRTDRDGEVQYRVLPGGKLERRQKRS